MNINYPQRIICLTEESVEWLYKLGEQDRIVGISQFVERPLNAKKNHPIITSFIKSNYKKINELNPDLILGFSDIQKDIARDLIEMGFNVWISNHRSLSEVMEYLLALGTLVNKRELSLEIIKTYQSKIENVRSKSTKEFRVYLEEWDDPKISAIKYFSEIVEICGGKNIFKEKANGFLARERFVDDKDVIKHNPEWILACWCGKKVSLPSILSREGWQEVEAIKKKQVLELDPAIFLQPGPALFENGLDIMYNIFNVEDNRNRL
jgi:iron complex transport system substrate-binding protein